jgi:prolyl-tRNA editing enzyme YbaK/EbsC (Cys-tRNA(Pro) deacylase)
MSDDLVLDELHRLGIEYTLMPCDPALADTAQFCEAYNIDPRDSANTILVVGKSNPRVYVACVLLATTRLDVNGVVRKRLGIRRTSFASADETAEITGMIMGGVTPFGLPDDLPVWVDAAVMARDSIVLGGGTRDRKIVAAPAALEQLPAVDVVADLAAPYPET